MPASESEREPDLMCRSLAASAGIRLVAFRKLALRLLGGSAATFCLCMPAMAEETSGETLVPSFAELQAAGAVIGEVRIVNNNIFNLDEPKEDNFLFRLANKLQDRKSVV